MSRAVRVALIGARGQMGRAIIEAAKESSKIEIVAECDLRDSIEKALSNSNVIVDFSHADSAEEICRAAAANHRALVIGTTGHTARQKERIEDAANVVPIVFASNFSVGVNILFALSREAAELFGNEFKVQIVETHHTRKKDAPSGTAKTLAQIVEMARKSDDETPIESIREGDVVGDHRILFSGPGEQLELTHRASSRGIFAHGALRAAEWIVGKSPRLYSMQDVIGL